MKRNERMKLIIYAVGLALMMIIRDVFDVGMSKYVCLAYVLTFFVLAQYQTLVYMVCYTIPLVCGLPGTYIMLGALVLLIIKCKKVNLWQIGLFAVVTSMELFASAWYPKSDIVAIIQYISYAGLVFFLIHDRTDIDFTLCLCMYLYGVAVLCGIIITTGIMAAPTNWMKQFAKGYFRFGQTQYDKNEGMQTALNANNLANYSASATFTGLLLMEKSKGFRRIIVILMTLLAVAGGFLTISRSWLLVLAICLFLYILGKVRNPKRFIATLLIFSVVFLIGFFAIGGTELIEGFVARMTDDDMSTGNGRTRLFTKYMDIFFRNVRFMIVGTGVTQYRAMTGNITSMHNGTQQILVCCGMIGFTVYMFGLIRPILVTRRERKIPMSYWLPLISTALYVQTTQFLNPTMLMLPYIVGIFAIKAAKNTTVKQESSVRNGKK